MVNIKKKLKKKKKESVSIEYGYVETSLGLSC